MVTGLVTDLLLIPLLERVPGRRVVRVSATLALLVYPAWLLVPWVWAKIGLAFVVRACTIGWYAVLQGEAYAALPERSGTVMALNSLAGLAGGALVWLVGWTAEQADLQAAMWLLLLGPLALTLFLPRFKQEI
jgi:FSR family fosmidomycin resistance protein-like MFS transporter